MGQGIQQRLRLALFEDVRYEARRWPLWRWDKNLRYIAKSLLHKPQPATPADARHYADMARYLAAAPWPAPHTAPLDVRAVGDLMWLREGYATAFSAGVRAQLAPADLTFANLETPLDDRRPVKRWTYETLRYNAPSSYLDAWSGPRESVQRQVFSVCNDHALDQGVDGLRATRDAIESAAHRTCVGGADDESQAVRQLEVDGVRFAVVGTTFGINPHPGNPTQVPGVPQLGFGDPGLHTDWAQVQRLLDRARAGDPDWIVLLPHWGFEYEYWPDAALRADAYRLLEMGFDLILGSSPHVLQPLEIVSLDGWDPACPIQLRRGAQPRPGVIAWSLGDFASIIPTLACQTGVVLGLQLGTDARAAPTLGRVHATPTITMRGLGDTWLAARTMTASEYEHAPRARGPASAHLLHARRILGPLVRGD